MGKKADRHTIAYTGQVCRLAREAAGLLQTELAEQLGVHDSAISALETGKSYMRFENMDRLAARFGLDGGAFSTTRASSPLGRILMDPDHPLHRLLPKLVNLHPEILEALHDCVELFPCLAALTSSAGARPSR